MASLGKRLKSGHQKTDSEALEDLSSAFHDLDIDGEGLLDQASFLTAIRMLGVTVPPSELEKIFEVLDEDDTGMIAYDKVKEFMKLGKIPSTILNKVKQTGGGASKKRKSIMFGTGPLIKNTPKKSGGALLPILAEEKERESDQLQKRQAPMDKNRVKMIQRAVIVIKKAAMKTISRDEVIEFLADKGMDIADIEFAYNKAQEQVMSHEERIKYLSDLSVARLNEANQQKNLNEFLSSQISMQSQEIQILRDILKTCTDTMIGTAPNANKSQHIIEKLAAQELTSKIQQCTKEVVNAEQEKDNQAAIVHKRDLETLQVISKCVTDKQHFHAFLYFHQLESVLRDSMPQLQEFLTDYEFPDEDIDED